MKLKTALSPPTNKSSMLLKLFHKTEKERNTLTTFAETATILLSKPEKDTHSKRKL